MSDIQRYLVEVDKNKADAQEVAQRSAEKLDRKELKLLDLIASLEPYINNKDNEDIRAKTLAFLAAVLDNVNDRTLSLQERRLLCDFLLGRLEGDVVGIGSTAKSLMSLEQKGKWDSSTAHSVVQAFIDHANPLKQFKLQSDRYAVIQLLDILLAKYRNTLQDSHEDDPMFLSGFIMLFEGEKDPRNLMIVFSMLQVIMTEWNIQSNAQDLFDTVFNYFPITFKPPPDDPYGITAQDLKDRLRACISASSDFAPYAFPALLDKLDSTSMNTKRDVLQALQDCITQYEANTINLYSVTLWDALKFEILSVQEEDLAVEALKALGLMAAKLVDAGEGPINAYLRPIIKECNEHLEDAPTKQSIATGRILHAVASGSPLVADKIVRGILPTLFELYRATESISKKRGLLEVLNKVLAAYIDIEQSGDTVAIQALQTFATTAKDAALRAVTHAPKAEVSYRLTALDTLVDLSRITTLLSSADANQIVDIVTDLVLHEHVPGHGDIKSAAIDRLVQLAHAQPSIVQNNCIPAFMVALPDNPADDEQYEAALEAFAQLSRERQIFDTVVLRLKNKHNAARHQQAPRQYQLDLLRALLFAFSRGSPTVENGAIRSDYFHQFATPLLESFRSDSNHDIDQIEMDIIGRLCLVLLKDQSHHFQSSIYNQQSGLFSPLDNNTSPSTAVLLYLYAALRQEIVQEQDALSQLTAVAALQQHQSSTSQMTSTGLRLVTLLVNKYLSPKTLDSTLSQVGLDAASLISGQNEPQRCLLAFAIGKALVLQGKTAALTRSYLSQLISLLPSMSRTQARLFSTLIAPDELLVKENHCNISGLYKQKTFTQLVPDILAGINTNDTAAKQKYITALSGVLKWLPYAVLQPSLHTLVTPLLQALDLKDPSDHDVQTAALTLFESILMHDPEVVAEHAASLISRLLACTAGVEKVAAVRAKALQCLALVPKQLKREKVVPYRRQVVKQLMKCLDDDKRNVRTQAVKCRTNWLALEEADDDDD